jgi:hypothetical protein
MESDRSARNPLASHWRADNWFGAQLGGTAWLFVSAGLLAFASPRSAAVVLACGLAANLAGCLLWSLRAQHDPYRAFQLLVVIIGLAGATATRWLELRGEFGLLDPRVPPRAMDGLLLALAVLLLAVFEVRRREALRSAS